MPSSKPTIQTPYFVGEWDVVELSASRTVYANASTARGRHAAK
jgi:hypothetical protein